MPLYVPAFGTGAPSVAIPISQPYFDTSTTPFTQYVFEAGAWNAVGTVAQSLFSPVRTQTGATYTFVTADAGEYIRFTGATVTVTVDTDAHQPMPANAEINFEATGGTVTVAAAGGVTINSPSGKLASSAQYVALTLKRTAINVWTLIGSLA